MDIFSENLAQLGPILFKIHSKQSITLQIPLLELCELLLHTISHPQGTLHIYLKHSLVITFVSVMAPSSVSRTGTSVSTISSANIFCNINNAFSLSVGFAYFTLCFRFRFAALNFSLEQFWWQGLVLQYQLFLHCC